MNNETGLSKRQWHLVTIRPKGGSTGDNMLNILKELIQCIPFKFVILGDINGSPKKQGEKVVFHLHEKENEMLLVDDVMKVLPQVYQFDWGDFYLFAEAPLKWNQSQNLTYPEIILQSDTTVRAIDDTYIYVYTTYESIVQTLKAYEGLESITTDVLENLVHPY